MSTQSVAPVNPTSQASPFLGTCKRCASPELFIKAQGPHFGLFCRQCHLWQKWIRKSEARCFKVVRWAAPKPTPNYPDAGEQVRAAFDSPRDDSHKSCSERFKKIEKELSGVNRQLLLFTKIILDQGILQGKQRPEFHIADEAAGELGRKLYELEFENGDRPASDPY